MKDEAAKEIRAISNRDDAHTIPIIAMTANAFAEDVHKSRQSRHERTHCQVYLNRRGRKDHFK